MRLKTDGAGNNAVQAADLNRSSASYLIYIKHTADIGCEEGYTERNQNNELRNER